MRHILLFAAVLLCSCTPAQLAGLKVANTIANGVACGMAAANGTPCTSQAVLDALARDAEAQRAKVEAVAPQAAAADPEMAKALLEQLKANTDANQKLAAALLALATREAPAPAASSPAPLLGTGGGPPLPAQGGAPR